MLDYDSLSTTESDLVGIAQKAQYLSKLPPHQLRRLIVSGTVKQFAGQTVVLEEGSAAEEIYLILRGTVAVSTYQALDPACWLSVSGQGTMVDMCALLDQPVSPVTILTLSELEVLAIPKSELMQVMQEESAVGCEIFRDLCTRLSVISQVALKECSQQRPGPSPN